MLINTFGLCASCDANNESLVHIPSYMQHVRASAASTSWDEVSAEDDVYGSKVGGYGVRGSASL